ncbi:hypothetical protein ACSFA3_24660, partial [Variovorax sp. RHLX14]
LTTLPLRELSAGLAEVIKYGPIQDRAFFDWIEAYIDALHVALPHATRSQAAWGYQFALGSLLHHLNDSRIERLSRGENTRADPAVAPMLVSFIVGGLRAALPRPKTPRTNKTIPRRQKP